MIFTIEKRRFRRGGELHETRSYYLRYRIGDMPVDKWKSLGVTDKQVADQKAHKFIQEREREAAGILEPQAVRDSARKPLRMSSSGTRSIGAVSSRQASKGVE